MTKQLYNDQTVNQYLLGALPESETERLDELSFTDDDFAETLSAAEKELVDAYVQGELRGTELERFKYHYLASPLRRQKVEFARSFQSFTRADAVARASQLQDSSSQQKAHGWFFNFDFFKGRSLAWQFGYAAMVLALIIAGAWLVLENMRLRQQASQVQVSRDEPGRREQELQAQLEEERVSNSQTAQELARSRQESERLAQELKKAQEQQAIIAQEGARNNPTPASRPPLSIASFILTPPLRSAGQVQTIEIPPGTDAVAMTLQLESDDYAAYTVSLLNPSTSKTVWRSGKLKARTRGDNKSLGVRLPAGLLKPQVYVLQVAGASSSGGSEIISDYPFKVVR